MPTIATSRSISSYVWRNRRSEPPTGSATDLGSRSRANRRAFACAMRVAERLGCARGHGRTSNSSTSASSASRNARSAATPPVADRRRDVDRLEADRELRALELSRVERSRAMVGEVDPERRCGLHRARQRRGAALLQHRRTSRPRPAASLICVRRSAAANGLRARFAVQMNDDPSRIRARVGRPRRPIAPAAHDTPARAGVDARSNEISPEHEVSAQ